MNTNKIVRVLDILIMLSCVMRSPWLICGSCIVTILVMLIWVAFGIGVKTSNVTRLVVCTCILAGNMFAMLTW